MDVVIPCVSGQLGLVCCQGVGVVIIDTVVPMSPAYRADLRRDDVVLAIDNKPVNNVAQVSKVLSSSLMVTIIFISYLTYMKSVRTCLSPVKSEYTPIMPLLSWSLIVFSHGRTKTKAIL